AIVEHAVLDERGAFAGGTTALQMCLVILPEIAQGGQHGIRRSFSEPAEAACADLMREAFQFGKILGLALTRAQPVEDIEHAPGANATERTFPTGLVLSELKEVAGDIDHARRVVQHDQAA